MKAWLRTYWPHVFGSIVACIVGLPAAIASYRHGMTVIQRSSDPGMAAWLPMTTDGLLLASLVALWVRRLTGRRAGRGPWAAFGLGLAAATATNLAGARLYIDKSPGFWDVVEAVGWAVWPPVCLAIVLEIIAWMVVPDAPVQVGLTGRDLAELDDVTGVAVLPAEDGEVTQDAASGYRTADYVPAGPAARTGPVPIESMAGDGNAPADDSDLIEQLRVWTAEESGVVPSRERVRVKFQIGTRRAERIRTALTDALTTESDRAVESPVRPHVVRSEESTG